MEGEDIANSINSSNNGVLQGERPVCAMLCSGAGIWRGGGVESNANLLNSRKRQENRVVRRRGGSMKAIGSRQ